MQKPAISVIDSNSYAKLTDPHSPFILVVHKGEDIIQSILKCANAINIPSAALTGLGALENPTIAYFDVEVKQYQNKTFPGVYELISLNGNIAQSNGERVLHIHVALGDEQYRVIGGHLQNAIVGITAEITIIPFKGPMIRNLNPELGVKLIDVKA